MKKLNLFLFLALVSSLSFSQTKIFIGMSLDTVKKIYPGIKEETFKKTTTLSRRENLFGLDDEWGYRFENGKLDWIFFDKYIDSLTEKNFKLCLSATQKIIKNYTQAYGKPDTTIKGNTRFIDPYKKHHWGYDVLEARWKNYKGMKIKVEFTFMGGKGEYHLLVKVNYFGKDYPYFD